MTITIYPLDPCSNSTCLQTANSKRSICAAAVRAFDMQILTEMHIQAA